MGWQITNRVLILTQPKRIGKQNQKFNQIIKKGKFEKNYLKEESDRWEDWMDGLIRVKEAKEPVEFECSITQYVSGMADTSYVISLSNRLHSSK